MSDEKKAPVSIELGASAKAEFKAEIRGEIPSSSMGRLVDAITDAFRPFTETRGLRADQIRLQREETLIEIARLTAKRMEIEQQTPQPVRPRVLVPLLEKASLADPDEETLIEAWSSLLQSASVNPNPNHAIFVDVLSKLDALHINFLDFIMNYEGVPRDMFLEREPQEMQYFLQASYKATIEDRNILMASESEAVNLLSAELLDFLRVPGCGQIAGGASMRVGTPEAAHYEFESAIDLKVFPEAIYNALEGLSLLTRHHVVHLSDDAYAWFDYCRLTMFGLEFFEACHPSNAGLRS